MSCTCEICTCDDTMEKIAVPCPECGNLSSSVPEKAILANLKKDAAMELKGKNVCLCSDSDCRISYFSEDNSIIFTVDDMRRPLWYKKEADPVIACYCNNILKDEVVLAVRNYNLTSWQDIVMHYRKKTLCICRKLNPAGNCCTTFFYSVINKTLQSIGKEMVPVPAGCTC